jgi:glyoxylase-like metal-dependent hydrolase (beta-lactamase superfamily II)
MRVLLMRAIAVLFLVLIAVGGVGLTYLVTVGLRDVEVPERAEYSLELARVRELARSVAGPLPVALNAVVVARAEQPYGSMVAGRSWLESVPRVFPAYQIVFPDRSIVVDGAFRDPVDPEAYGQLQQALRQASSILLTHTHADHTLSIGRSPHLAELVPRLALTPAQLSEPFGLRRFPEGSLDNHRPLSYEARLAFAPGVVLIAAPGHTAGSQMVYVQLAGGAEILLLGDVVWDMENVRSLKGRPHAIGSLYVGGDEAKVAHQIRALHDALEQEAGRLHMLPSHDPETLAELQRSGIVGERFALP